MGRVCCPLSAGSDAGSAPTEVEGDRAGGESARLLLSDQSPAPAPFPHPAAKGLSAARKLGRPGLQALGRHGLAPRRARDSAEGRSGPCATRRSCAAAPPPPSSSVIPSAHALSAWRTGGPLAGRRFAERPAGSQPAEASRSANPSEPAGQESTAGRDPARAGAVSPTRAGGRGRRPLGRRERHWGGSLGTSRGRDTGEQGDVTRLAGDVTRVSRGT